MPSLVAPARVACTPMPFLLRDQFDALGDLVVVPDDKWDAMIVMTRSWLLPGKDVIIVETEQGPFMVIPDGVFDQKVMKNGNFGD